MSRKFYKSSPGLSEPGVLRVLLLPVLAGLFSFLFWGHLAKPAPSATSSGVPGPAPRQDAWQVIGPGGGGTMIQPTISPHDANIVVEHCDMTGAYITTDGGLTAPPPDGIVRPARVLRAELS